MWPQQPGDLEKSNFEKPQNRKKWATLVLKQQNQNFKIATASPVWPQFLDSPDLLWQI